jgi:adenylate cyclase
MNIFLKWIKSNKTKLSIFVFSYLVTLTFTQEYFFTIDPIKKLALKFIDQRFTERGEINIQDSADVIIVELNQESDEQIPAKYSQPYPRWFYAKVIENLNEAGVKAIGIDVVFSNPDNRYNEPNDELLFNSIRKYGNVVVAGKVNISQESLQENINDKTNASNVAVIKRENENYGNIFFAADSSVGIVQTVRDYDGVLRSYLPYIYSQVSTYRYIPTFSFAVLNKYFGKKQFYCSKNLGSHFEYNNIIIPKYEPYSVLVNYYGPDATFRRIKFIDVIDDKDFKTKTEEELGEDINLWDNPDYGLFYSGIFKNKIVLIGSTEPEDRDYFQTSFQKKGVDVKNQMYGVEYHANMIQNVLWKDFIYMQSKTSEAFMLLFIFAIVFWGSSVIKELKFSSHWLIEIINASLILLLIWVFYRISFYMFTEHHYILTFIRTVISILISYFAITVFYFLNEKSQKKLIKGMFSHYVTGDLVTELLNNPEKLKLGGEKRNLTILFSDIAGFTTFSEKLSATELVNFINHYLNEMTKIVLNNKGTLDKYIGDAVMAFWGAPVEVSNHEELACKTAIEMQKKLTELRNIWEIAEAKQLNVRIGINSGEVVVGNIGGETRFDYTVMGDNVNLASRLEGANKQYETLIMIGENVYNAISDKIIARELDNIRVKGKYKPTKVYELIGMSDDETARDKLKQLSHYQTGIELYKNQKFVEALNEFNEGLKIIPDDGPSKVYIERCNYYIQNPPADDWDKVFVMKTK